ncbi:hypothetical protein [Halomicrobium zhouii]|uniref:hypothetical protein n=1 Tax=Halomicrobium zhouii TaxID=767519 RepID=UPI001160CB3A|nr:hypothetical protein [Halomicrobium zhouii]
MVISAPGFDRDLSGHSAVELERAPGICHAVVSEFNEDGEQQDETECGVPTEDDEIRPKLKFDDKEIEYCEECWPPTVLETE